MDWKGQEEMDEEMWMWCWWLLKVKIRREEEA